MNEIKTTKNSPEKVSLEKDKNIFGVPAVFPETSHFVMEHIRLLTNLNLTILKSRKQKSIIYVIAKKLKIHLFATDLTTKSLDIFF